MGNAHSSRPEIQARRLALTPEQKRRREIVMRLSRRRSPAGQARFLRAQAWMIAWREAGFPQDFPELEDWPVSERTP